MAPSALPGISPVRVGGEDVEMCPRKEVSDQQRRWLASEAPRPRGPKAPGLLRQTSSHEEGGHLFPRDVPVGAEAGGSAALGDACMGKTGDGILEEVATGVIERDGGRWRR